MKKQLISLLLTVCMIVPMTTVFAQDRSLGAEQQGIIDISDSVANTLYKGEKFDSGVFGKNSIRLYQDVPSFGSVSDAAEYMRAKLVKRQGEISIGYSFRADHELSGDELRQIDRDIFDIAVKHTGVPAQGDYLKWQYKSFNCHIGGSVDQNVYSLVFDYTVEYRSDAEQEAEVTLKVKNAMSGMKLNGLSTADKVRKIYGYICKNVKYDFGNRNPMCYTAYGAIVDNLCVCQGYSLLFYRMALDQGIDARIITGTGNTGAHGWNIVRIGSRYYNLDCTWDAGRNGYKYFLIGSEEFAKDHMRGQEYTSEKFNAEYPMSKTAYKSAENLKKVTLSNLYARSGGFKARWSASGSVSGYQLQYSRSSKFSNAKTRKVPGGSNKTKTITGLSSRKKYYVRVRSYKKATSGRIYYSEWSNRKYIVTKK